MAIEFDKSSRALKMFLESYPEHLPDNVFGPYGASASWSDLVWYVKAPDTGIKHRYIFTKPKDNSTRYEKDRGLLEGTFDKAVLFTEHYERLLKIYALHVQSENIVNNSKQQRVTIASKILSEASDYNSLNDLPIKVWNEYYLSNIFWDFCKKNNIIKQKVRPSHRDRSRYTEDIYSRNLKKEKEVPDDLIMAAGVIYNQVFKAVNENGIVEPGEVVDIKDAIAITAVLLGLASPNRTNAELPLLPNQVLKSVSPKKGKTVYYLDWPGSKGFQDNLNHILSVLAPQVTKAINFFSKTFEPERVLVRYLKNRDISWPHLLSGFEVNNRRKKNLDFKVRPNLFTVGYAIGFYPINATIPILKHRSLLASTKTRSKWRYATGKHEQVKDCFIDLPVYRVENHHLIVTGFTDSRKINGLFALLLINNITQNLYTSLSLKKVETVSNLEQILIKNQLKSIPSFPVGYASTDSGIDLESSLFCVSPYRHGIRTTLSIVSSPYFLYSPKQIQALFSNHLSPRHTETKRAESLFEKYGFGSRNLKLHSLRHFANTNAEKGGVPISVISVWSGRRDVTQTLEYVHTSDEEKSDRVVATLGFNEKDKDIRIITKNDLKTKGLLPASLTDFGVCLQELSVSPCNHLSDFLSGCFGCENSGYVCGDKKAIETLELDLSFQRQRLAHIRSSDNFELSQATKNWCYNHSQSVDLLQQLIKLMKTEKYGNLIRFSQKFSEFFVTDVATRTLTRIPIALPSPAARANSGIDVDEGNDRSIPDEMTPLLEAYGIDTDKSK